MCAIWPWEAPRQWGKNRGTEAIMPASATASPLRLRLPAYIVIPARLASTRLPRKLLLRETGKTLIEHTFEAACRANRPMGVCVATDSEEIAAEVRRFGGRAIMTDSGLASGTDRVAQAAGQLPDARIIVNVQGDEPELSGESIDRAIDLLEADPAAVMATLATPIRSKEKLFDPACVKVVFDSTGRALYFSRAPIPFVRDWRDDVVVGEPPRFFQHIGLYAYRREFLLRLAQMPRSPHEELENLEQLRVLDAGHTIRIATIDEPAIGIDTPRDYAEFVARQINPKRRRGA
jgi:3-deoxy-manno-octulosonate cytidylyltransferase (CMP-KDO synthetase)